jgi:hypothetical protein
MDFIISKKICLYQSLLLCLKSDIGLDDESLLSLENENDINTIIDFSEVKKISLDYEIDYIDVSSKDNYNIKESFNIILNKMLIKVGFDLSKNINNSEDSMSTSGGCLIF